jgi:hypothetical protein
MHNCACYLTRFLTIMIVVDRAAATRCREKRKQWIVGTMMAECNELDCELALF